MELDTVVVASPEFLLMTELVSLDRAVRGGVADQIDVANQSYEEVRDFFAVSHGLDVGPYNRVRDEFIMGGRNLR